MTRTTDGNGQIKDNGEKRRWRLTDPYGDTFLPADECLPNCGRSDGGCEALECDYFDRVITRLGKYEDAGVQPEDMKKVKELLRRDEAARPARDSRVAVSGTTWSEAYKCPACGGGVVERAAFCHNCGQHLEWGV